MQKLTSIETSQLVEAVYFPSLSDVERIKVVEGGSPFLKALAAELLQRLADEGTTIIDRSVLDTLREGVPQSSEFCDDVENSVDYFTKTFESFSKLDRRKALLI